MGIICIGCQKTFTKGSSLRMHHERFPSHSKLTVSEVFKEHNVDRRPITDALRDADLLYLPAAKTKQLEMFGDFAPRIASVKGWKSSYSFKDIRRITLSSMMQSTNPPQVWEPEAEKATSDYDTAASVILDIDAEENPPQAHIMEIPLPSLEDQVARIREVYDDFTVYNRKPVSANVTPKSTLIDIHYDPGYTVLTLFGKPKFIAIYPPTEENLRVFQGQYGQGNKFLSCYQQLKGGVFVVMKDGQTLLLPPYNLHLTFSIGGSIICGYEVEAIEFFPVMISRLDVEIEFLDNQYQNESDRRHAHGLNLESLLDGLESTLLRRGNDEMKGRVVVAWITNISTIKEAFQKAEGYEDRACDIWGKFLNDTKITQCPSCSGNSRPFKDHMMSQHVAIIQCQRLGVKKRARPQELRAKTRKKTRR